MIAGDPGLFAGRRRYRAIYADPPWAFQNRSDKGTGRNAVSHYDCLDFPALARLPVADLADDDCALFLWAVDPLLDRAMDLIRAWGFAYKTVGFYWVKLNPGRRDDARFDRLSFDRLSFFIGLGYWTRANPEQCLACHARQAAPPRPRRRASRSRAAPRAQPQAGRRPRAHRAPGRRPLSRTLRPRDEARLGRSGRRGRPLRRRPRRNAPPALPARPRGAGPLTHAARLIRSRPWIRVTARTMAARTETGRADGEGKKEKQGTTTERRENKKKKGEDAVPSPARSPRVYARLFKPNPGGPQRRRAAIFTR